MKERENVGNLLKHIDEFKKIGTWCRMMTRSKVGVGE